MVPLETDATTTTDNQGDGRERRQRADARRNRQRVLDAAEELFAEHGVKAQIDEIARHAGVGTGTVCRNFPTKEALIQAVVARRWASRLEAVRAAAEADDPANAFHDFFVSNVEFQARNRLLAERMAGEVDVTLGVQPIREEFRALLSTLVKRAQAARTVRADIGPADIAMLFSGVAHATTVSGDLGPTLRERYVAIILDGLRPIDPTPLPGKPLGFPQLQRLKERARERTET
jgi:AcrR family transcriptional regulator